MVPRRGNEQGRGDRRRVDYSLVILEGSEAWRLSLVASCT